MEDAKEVLIGLHLQDGYGHGTAEDEVLDYIESFDGPVIGLAEPGQGEMYGGRGLYDCILEGCEIGGQLYDEVRQLFEESFDNYRVIGLYGSECVANLVDCLGREDVRVDSEAVIDQKFGHGDYLVSDRLSQGTVGQILEYSQEFLNPEVLGRFSLPQDEDVIGRRVDPSISPDELGEIESMPVREAVEQSDKFSGGFDNPPNQEGARARIT